MTAFIDELTVIAGTRPEAIKFAPLVKRLRESQRLKVNYVSSGQHMDMFKDTALSVGTVPDVELKKVSRDIDLDGLLGELIPSIGRHLSRNSSKNVLILGDTATTLASAIAATNNRCKIFHVEAGLRSGDLYDPYPEESYRMAVSRFAHYHFCPSSQAMRNLINEGIDNSDKNISVTGSTIFESVSEIMNENRDIKFFMNNEKLDRSQWSFLKSDKYFKILVTAHRRENIPFGIEQICSAAIEIIESIPRSRIVLPMHPNPKVKKIIEKRLASKRGIKLTRELDYPEMLWLIDNSDLIISDSAGVMEEASILGTPLLIARKNTERKELIRGYIKQPGPDADRILKAAKAAHKRKGKKRFFTRSPFSRGNAVEQITSKIEQIILDNRTSNTQ